MIGFALPWILGLAGAAALAITALHLLSVRRPPELLLPTARFLPDREVRAVSRTRRPSDLLLLVLRVGLLLAAGVAIAGPVWRTRATQDVVLVVAAADVVRDTAALRALLNVDTLRPSRVVYVFADSQPARRSPAPDLAALLPLAVRAAARLAQADATIDTFDLHLVARYPASDTAAYTTWRATWPGRVTTHVAPAQTGGRRVVVVDHNGRAIAQAAGDSRGKTNRISTDGRDEDVVPIALAWHAARISGLADDSVTTTDTVGVDRRDAAGRSDPDADHAGLALSRDPSAPTLAGAVRAPNHVTLIWPTDGVPRGWSTLRQADTVTALAAAGVALPGPWAVTATPSPTGDDAPLLWWSDGRIAATEGHSTGDRCSRLVSIVTTSVGDLLLSRSANALFDRLLSPCVDASPIDPRALTAGSIDGRARASARQFLRGAGAANDGPSGVPASDVRSMAWLTPLLLGVAVLLLLVEWRVRQSRVAAAT